MTALSDVFSVEEIARAAGVPRDSVDQVLAAASARPLAGTAFFTGDDALRAGVEARRVIASHVTRPGDTHVGLFASAPPTPLAERRKGLPSFLSSLVHGAFALSMLWATSGSPQSASVEHLTPRLVFLPLTGPGGGGGGGGLRNPLAPRTMDASSRVQRTRDTADVSLRKTLVTTRPIGRHSATLRRAPESRPAVEELLPSRRLAAPVAPTTGGQHLHGSVLTRGEAVSASLGEDGGSGTGRGTGDGQGTGDGIGPGSGGGTGGGPYREGSGVEPPRLVREVKATYTDDARRRGTTGYVVLEIVINRDGSVGDIAVRRRLGAGLDERAIEAVRQWRFVPARRLGKPVDAIVEVAVEFVLR